jgi:NAD(P) transhydrogenase
MQGAKQGKLVAVVERMPLIGGACTHWGTIPSKSLRHAIFQMTEANNNPLFRSAGLAAHLEFRDLRKAAKSVIDRQVEMRRGFYDRNDISVVTGRARFLDPQVIEVEDDSGLRQRLGAKACVIATGSRPYRPPDVDFTHPRIFDSDTILSLERSPHAVTIYGAGVVGCEYTSMFRNLECKVNLVNTRSKLLEFLDDEIIDALSYHMRERGVVIRHNETYDKITGADDGVILSLKSGKQLKTDVLLWANGRTGNTDDLGLEQLGVPHVYAVGDVIGFPALASAAYVQGRYAASHALHGTAEKLLVRDIPTGIYTSPEISSLGQTERELTANKVPYEIGHAQFRSLARAQITGQTEGMLKLLFHRETLEILGVHCFGANAAEIIHIGQAIMAQPGRANSLLYFINTTFNYPTMAEAYRVAALNGYNRLF